MNIYFILIRSVIHLLNNGRYEYMMKQLNTYKPSEKVYIRKYCL